MRNDTEHSLFVSLGHGLRVSVCLYTSCTELLPVS